MTSAGESHRLLVVGGGPAGLAAAAEAAEAGHEVVLVERSDRLGGQLALAGATPGTGEISRAFIELYARRLAEAEVEIELDTGADADVVAAYFPAAVVVATGARPYEPNLPLAGIQVVQAWDLLAGPIPQGRRAVVADWGGDPSGLDAAELLAGAGNDVTLAVASVAVGEAIHQYRRNLYLQRLYRAGVAIVHHYRLAGTSDSEVELANVFAPERVTRIPADVLVLALGRVPEAGLAPALTAAGFSVEEVGDCLSPRSIEEAVLEGTLAARRLLTMA